MGSAWWARCSGVEIIAVVFSRWDVIPRVDVQEEAADLILDSQSAATPLSSRYCKDTCHFR
jgi:hypothetical protein